MHIHGWRSSFRFPQRRRRNVATRWHCRPRHRWRRHHRPRNRSCKGIPGLRHWERHGVWKSWDGLVRAQCMRQAHRAARHGWPIAWGQTWNGALQGRAWQRRVAHLAVLELAASGLGHLLAVDQVEGQGWAGRARESVQATLKTQQVSAHLSWQLARPELLGLATELSWLGPSSDSDSGPSTSKFGPGSLLLAAPPPFLPLPLPLPLPFLPFPTGVVAGRAKSAAAFAAAEPKRRSQRLRASSSSGV